MAMERKRLDGCWFCRPALLAPAVVAMLAAAVLCTLTNGSRLSLARQPAAASAETSDPPPVGGGAPRTEFYTITGRCIFRDNQAPAAAVVRLFQLRGRTASPEEVAQTRTDAEGRYEFKHLAPPRPDGRLNRLRYVVFAQFADGPLGVGGLYTKAEGLPDPFEICLVREKTTLRGRVVDAEGQPVSGATVSQCTVDGRAIPGIFSSTTNVAGEYAIEDVPFYKTLNEETRGYYLTIFHPDFPETAFQGALAAAPSEITLPSGCAVTGTVVDDVKRRPAAGAVVTLQDVESAREAVVEADVAGRFRIVVPEGRYHVAAEAEDRVGVALVDRECLAGESLELPPLVMAAGGWVAGRVINTKTGLPVAVTDEGAPIAIGLYGPSSPRGRVIRPTPLLEVDAEGRFLLRAAPGDNYPYFVNIRGDRMAWDAEKQPPIVVREGKATICAMTITPPMPAAEKLKAAERVVDALPKAPRERAGRIIEEFRKLNHTVDETELWCTLMRELVAMGRDAVPPLCEELDRTNEDRMLRRSAFALRAIGDPRAVPALIRSIPRSLQPSSSDYGLIVEDPGLAAFMQQHDLGEMGGTYFNFGRPVREVFGALHALTKQDFADAEIFSMSLSEDPCRAVLQRRIYQRQAARWQTWWDAHATDLVGDPDYVKVNLNAVDEPLPPPVALAGRHARLADGVRGATVSPAEEVGEFAWHFLDLDTGFRPRWPDHLRRDEARLDEERLAAWAAENGVDLMCLTHRTLDGTMTFVLRGFDLRLTEIGAREVRNLDRLLAAGTPPEGRRAGDLLMHFDADAQQYVPDANAAFLYTTREGNHGLIEITDRVTRTADLTGGFSDPPRGVGFRKGVRFDWKAIIP
jgi:hypothetical protein